MLTAFGKFTRKLRIDNGELLKDMADKLQVTSAYLSSVETGKRTVPHKWASLIQETYLLPDSEYEELLNCIDESREEVIFNLSSIGAKDKDIILSFARKFDDLDESAKEKIKEILK
jgi:transcriptional regulator with XRE-family HTH domain